MATSPQTDRLRAVAAPAVESVGLVLEDLTITPVGRRRLLRVTVDLDEGTTGGVPVDAVAEAAQAVSKALDASDVLGDGPYVLEVSSPGVDRPLTQYRHWARARGRLVRAVLTGGEAVTGRLSAVDRDGVLLGGRSIGWQALASGRVEVEFNRPEGEAPPDEPVEAPPDRDEPDSATAGGRV